MLKCLLCGNDLIELSDEIDKFACPGCGAVFAIKKTCEDNSSDDLKSIREMFEFYEKFFRYERERSGWSRK